MSRLSSFFGSINTSTRIYEGKKVLNIGEDKEKHIQWEITEVCQKWKTDLKYSK